MRKLVSIQATGRTRWTGHTLWRRWNGRERDMESDSLDAVVADLGRASAKQINLAFCNGSD
jgi:hypothetical protein